jgi:uncharacterized protein (UPF0332 family)
MHVCLNKISSMKENLSKDMNCKRLLFLKENLSKDHGSLIIIIKKLYVRYFSANKRNNSTNPTNPKPTKQ